MKKILTVLMFSLWLALAYLASSASADFPPLSVRETDGSPNVKGVREIRVSNGSLTNIGGGVVAISTVGLGVGADGAIRATTRAGSVPTCSFDTLSSAGDQYAGIGPSSGNLMLYSANAGNNSAVAVLQINGNIGGGARSVSAAQESMPTLQAQRFPTSRRAACLTRRPALAQAEQVNWR